jgi:hypothetical protein
VGWAMQSFHDSGSIWKTQSVVIRDYTKSHFRGNDDDTCAAQVLYWLACKSNPSLDENNKSTLEKPLISDDDRVIDIQRKSLSFGNRQVIENVSDKFVDATTNITTTTQLSALMNKHPTYTLIGIKFTSGLNDIYHAIGFYDPYFGRARIFDPNFAEIEINFGKKYEVLLSFLEDKYGLMGVRCKFVAVYYFSDPETKYKALSKQAYR